MPIHLLILLGYDQIFNLVVGWFGNDLLGYKLVLLYIWSSSNDLLRVLVHNEYDMGNYLGFQPDIPIDHLKCGVSCILLGRDTAAHFSFTCPSWSTMKLFFFMCVQHLAPT